MENRIINECLLGVDFGTKKIGISIKRPKTLRIEYLGNFKNEGDVIGKFIGLIKKENIDKIIIGLPTGLSNKETKITKIITGFIQSLSSCLPKNISITTINENQSTKEALYKINILNKKEKEKDTISAGIILERYIKENVRE